MSDIKYPHRVTIAMSEEFLEKLRAEMIVRYYSGELRKSHYDSVVLESIAAIGKNDTTFPIYLDSIEGVESDD